MTMTTSSSPLPPLHNNKRKRPRAAVSMSAVAICLACCCVVSLVVSFLHGSVVLMQHHQPSLSLSLQQRFEHLSLLPPPPPPRSSNKNNNNVKKTFDAALFGRPAGVGNNNNNNNNNNGTLPSLPEDKQPGHLSCEEYGGPMEMESTQEMVYWQDIIKDESYVSPFRDEHNPKYITFEPDHGGFNNIRMAMETVLCLAVATGRILVLPPDQKMYLLNNEKGNPHKAFGFQDFFPIYEMAQHVKGLHVISMQEFLESEFVQSQQSQQLPPHNQTNWDGSNYIDIELYPYLRKLGYSPETWDPQTCMAAIPAKPNSDDTLKQIFQQIQSSADGGFPSFERFVGNPTSVRASVKERWMEHNTAERNQLCLYDPQIMQSQPVLHFAGKKGHGGGRLLTHFYSFLFFEDWKTDLWMKRFVRDHVRYDNEIQCAAARIVHAIRRHVRQKNPANNSGGAFDAFHVRRGDFQYKKTRVSADEMYDMCKDEIPEGTTVYMATDEVHNKSFFDPLAKHYDLLFLDDFQHLIGDRLSPNYYGMLDQLVAARSRTFFGCWFSTFTGYINRLRGYDSDLHKLPGFVHGIIDSYYYAIADKKMRMREYWPISGAVYAREFPTAWRNIDHGIGQV